MFVVQHRINQGEGQRLMAGQSGRRERRWTDKADDFTCLGSCRVVGNGWLLLSLVLLGHVQVVAASEGWFSPATADDMHSSISQSLTRSAQWLDAFFGDPVFDAEQNDTRLRVRFDTTAERFDSLDFAVRASLRLRLPGTERQWSLFIQGEDDDDDNELVSDLDEPSGDGSAIGVRYFFGNTLRRSISISASLKRRGGEYGLFLRPRFRRLWNFEPWNLRATQTVGYHTHTGFEADSRLDLERLLNDALFFRTTARLEWEEEEPGVGYSLGILLRQWIDSHSILSYEWNNAFETRPGHQLDASVFSATFRRRFWRDWLFYEVSPRLDFSEEHDYRANPGIRLRLEILFGDSEFRL